ncbi:hypothetical protein LTR36_002577 [Oleoguttula mirabilis]|uniref:Uncharacterized protein n=1 Tax=Oleoguttula mirabilis TaxID=1507867 RepID=A0AAV9JL02_9PEZI|nr:hypothetical protein LTR36_002577 [Oleoguttula mirabilis]
MASKLVRSIFIGRERDELTELLVTSNAVVAEELQRKNARLSIQAENLRDVLEYHVGLIKDMQRPSKSSPGNLEAARIIKQHVADPALELGLPLHIAIQMLVRFSVSRDNSLVYKGCHDALYERGGLPAMIDKIIIDTSLTVFSVLRPGPLRAQLWERASEVRQHYMKIDELLGAKKETMGRSNCPCAVTGQGVSAPERLQCQYADAAAAHASVAEHVHVTLSFGHDKAVEDICEGLKELRGWPSLSPQVAKKEAVSWTWDVEKQ